MIEAQIDYEDNFLRLTVIQGLLYSTNLSFKCLNDHCSHFFYNKRIFVSIALTESNKGALPPYLVNRKTLVKHEMVASFILC